MKRFQFIFNLILIAGFVPQFAQAMTLPTANLVIDASTIARLNPPQLELGSTIDFGIYNELAAEKCELAFDVPAFKCRNAFNDCAFGDVNEFNCRAQGNGQGISAPFICDRGLTEESIVNACKVQLSDRINFVNETTAIPPAGTANTPVAAQPDGSGEEAPIPNPQNTGANENPVPGVVIPNDDVVSGAAGGCALSGNPMSFGLANLLLAGLVLAPMFRHFRKRN